MARDLNSQKAKIFELMGDWTEDTTPNVDEFMDRINSFREEIVSITEEIEEKREEINNLKDELNELERIENEQRMDYNKTLAQKVEKSRTLSDGVDKKNEHKEVFEYMKKMSDELVTRLKKIIGLFEKN
mmetsp:Transcript_4642/g.9494  ORF Transcript_4642/g.9494 Transcript_4642/m.9494 type:complete len:129 (+) Transcript_4642:737-1123(+)